METSHLPDALKEVLAERSEIRADLDRLNHRDAALARVEAGLRELLGGQSDQLPLPGASEGSVSSNGSTYPRSNDLVLAMLEEAPRGLSATGIVNRAREAGLLDPRLKQPRGTVLEAAKRLADKGAIRRRKKGNTTFFYFRRDADKGG